MKPVFRLITLIVAPAVLLGVMASGFVRAVDIRGAGGATRPPSQAIGVAGCAAAACHGGTRPGERSEYMTWIQHDKHARAFSVLFNDRSQRIARNLGLEKPETDKGCLACHSTAADDQHGDRFVNEDGVSCEACHGPASRWLVPHSRPKWKKKSDAEKYGPFGMTNTKDLAVRASVCVSCHVGTANQYVDHDLIAAGHPSLRFELDAYTANMPPHWREPSDNQLAQGAQAWATGQAVILKQSLELLRAQATDDRWPELAQFECYSCHHELKEKSWRQAVGYGARTPGGPVWSMPQWLIVQRLATLAGGEPATVEGFDSLRTLLSRPNSSASDVATAAAKAIAITAKASARAQQVNWDAPRLRQLLVELAGGPDPLSLDYATARCITMALGAVVEALVQAESVPAGSAGEWIKQVRPALDRLYDDLQEPSQFDAPKFLTDLTHFRNTIPK